ncbi:MAG: hypothetical protein JOY64_12980 [Alphaproteobacteria bacterium]|nr:hypothetical protein [Alphaproteobacteria bacterium]
MRIGSAHPEDHEKRRRENCADEPATVDHFLSPPLSSHQTNLQKTGKTTVGDADHARARHRTTTTANCPTLSDGPIAGASADHAVDRVTPRWRVRNLCCLQKEFDLDGIKWKFDAAAIVAVDDAGSRKRRYIAMHREAARRVGRDVKACVAQRLVERANLKNDRFHRSISRYRLRNPRAVAPVS